MTIPGYPWLLRWPGSDGRTGWRGPDVAKERLSIDLDRGAREAIDTLLAGVDRPDLPLTAIRREDFADPRLDAALQAVDREVKLGHGVAYLRGLEIGRYSLDQLRRIYWGIGTFFGRTVSQSGKGEHLSDVVAKPDGIRGYDSDAELDFHNDLAELISLLAVQPAATGGINRFASMLAAWEVLRQEHPEYLAVLERGFYLDRAVGSPHCRQGAYSDHPVPIFSERDGVRSCWLTLPARAGRCAEARGVPLTDLEERALRALEALVQSDELTFSAFLAPGEMVFVNNYEVVHSRTSFTQFSEPEQARRLLRIWLESPEPRPIVREMILYPNASGRQGMDAAV